MTHQSKLVEITSAIKEIVYHLAREDYDYLEERGRLGMTRRAMSRILLSPSLITAQLLWVCPMRHSPQSGSTG